MVFDPTEDPILLLNRLSKQFDRLTAVNQVDLRVNRGEIFGFLGPNGAGKTTTIKIIAGLLLPSSGSVTICGHSLATENRLCRQLTGYIPDRPYLYEKLTGSEYLSFIDSLYRQTGRAAPLPETARDYLDLFDLLPWQDNLIESYSHGMRQKLIMTSMLMLDVPLLVVDEPMVGLDPKSARIVKELFRRRARNGGTIFLSTHSMEIAEELCDRISIIVNGSTIASGTVAALKRERALEGSNLEELFLQLTGAVELQQVIAALRGETAS
ncbi:ABC transporter ATP-binding protein [Desulfofustis limnaeus]|jgi:ABC-2 type transport system ATP-binding protein|uniref:ABC transporter n=1 Tax=Desulfofustis limnaeus TaxID=2740163 RepID=A0ABN6M710_9BACT|nr:ABC transporter ATP-binding protein [Desulfofustis limnaeus]MDX9894771.1 ABC transporter ATP-binding protein [Desulfofustis sp.]BDD87819.1 ABC transporter [Desulfofustis limnaeus]